MTDGRRRIVREGVVDVVLPLDGRHAPRPVVGAEDAGVVWLSAARRIEAGAIEDDPFVERPFDGRPELPSGGVGQVERLGHTR